MTSRISFSRLVCGELREKNWLTAVQLVIFVLFLPFRALMSMAIRESELTRNGSAVYSAVEQFSRHVGLGHTENTLLILLLGAVGALTTFSYLYSRVKQDFYHSLSLKREALFGIRYLSSALTFVIAYLTGQLLSVLVGAFYQALTGEIVLEMALASLQGILFYLCSYSTTLVAMMLTGNFLTAFLAIGAFGIYIPMIKLLADSYAGIFWNTGVAHGISFKSSWLRYTSPWAWCLYSGSYGIKGETGKIPGVGTLCQIIAIIAILTLTAMALYRARKTEIAGSALAYPILEPVIKILVGVPVSLIAGLIAYELVQSVVFEVLFILIFGALTCAVIEFIYRMDIRQVLKHKGPFVFSFVIACVIFFVYRFDLTGYNTYLPAEDKIESMSVVSTMSTTYIAYDEDGNISYSSSPVSYLDQAEWEDFSRIYELAADGVENVKKYGLSDLIYDQNVSGVYIKYHLKNGKEVYRYYQVDTELYCEVMDDLLAEDEFREKYFAICSWDGETVSKISSVWVYFYGEEEVALFQSENLNASDYAGAEEDSMTESDSAVTADSAAIEDTAGMETDSESAANGEEEDYYAEYYSYVNMTVPLSRLSELIEAYREDLKTVSFEDINYSYGGEISFYLENTYRTDVYMVNVSFKNTMALLQEIYLEQQG